MPAKWQYQQNSVNCILIKNDITFFGGVPQENVLFQVEFLEVPFRMLMSTHQKNNRSKVSLTASSIRSYTNPSKVNLHNLNFVKRSNHNTLVYLQSYLNWQALSENGAGNAQDDVICEWKSFHPYCLSSRRKIRGQTCALITAHQKWKETFLAQLLCSKGPVVFFYRRARIFWWMR